MGMLRSPQGLALGLGGCRANLFPLHVLVWECPHLGTCGKCLHTGGAMGALLKLTSQSHVSPSSVTTSPCSTGLTPLCWMEESVSSPYSSQQRAQTGWVRHGQSLCSPSSWCTCQGFSDLWARNELGGSARCLPAPLALLQARWSVALCPLGRVHIISCEAHMSLEGVSMLSPGGPASCPHPDSRSDEPACGIFHHMA